MTNGRHSPPIVWFAILSLATLAVAGFCTPVFGAEFYDEAHGFAMTAVAHLVRAVGLLFAGA